MIDQTVSELASESLNVAASVYNAFETPITLVFAILGVIAIIGGIIAAFRK